ncbi:MAG: isoleucine--tRNA ligase [archaeon]
MLDFHKVEKDVLEFWEKEKIYEKVKKKNSKGKKFYFLQGPPYTSGKLHIGQAWNNTMKDMALRYKRMQGFDVWDRGGYDMHGLPTENAVQKKMGFKNKDEIEKHGVEKFIKECINFSVEYAGYMDEDLWKMGVWLDHKNAYKPLTKDYVSGEWFFFKRAQEQGRLYKGKKVMHWDAETETSLAKHELEYKTVKEESVFLKFKKKGTKDEYFVIWTTTPWTIPYNLAIMANPKLEYVKIKVDKEYWIMAKALVDIFMGAVVGKKFEVVDKFMGRDLEGQEYEHFLDGDMPGVYKSLKKEWPNVHTVILSRDYVDTSAGSGLVHCAPGCGPEDQEVGAQYGIGAFNTLSERGELEGVGKYNGMVAKKDDAKFIEIFREKGVLIATNEVEHEYPHSDRSKQPVVFRTTEQWFLRTEDLIKDLLRFNKEVHWEPKRSGESYARWAENLRDNGVTRQRYWGCPVPIWINVEDEEDYMVVGSSEELEKLTGKKFDDLTIHRPWIDKIMIEKDGKKYRRIEDVADVWIDSGTASWNCLYNDPKLIKKYFPADLILEATEQTRLWFSLLQICSAVVFGKTSYKNVYTHGMIFDFEGMKMSKSLGNIISPYEVIDKYSVDVMRNYLCAVTAGETISFNWEDVKVKHRNLMMLANIANYIGDLETHKPKKGKPGVEERWIISKYNSTLERVTELFNEYRLDETIPLIEGLYVALSRDYIKFVRDKALENSAVLETLKEVYLGILKMFAPIVPFMTESLWGQMGQKEESVHLCKWPKFDLKKIDTEIEVEFDVAMKMIEKGLAERDKAKVGLRWPLSKAVVKSSLKLNEELESVVKGQLNIKRLEIKNVKDKEIQVELHTLMTPALEAEGYSRELARKIQAERKKAGLKKGELIDLEVFVDGKLKKMLEEHLDFLKERTNSRGVKFVDKIDKDAINFKIKDDKIEVKFH